MTRARFPWLALGALLTVLFGPAPSIAQGNAGQANSLLTRVAALEAGLAAEVAARIAAVQAEIAARTNADAMLQSNIEAEVAARIAGDMVLQYQIDPLSACPEDDTLCWAVVGGTLFVDDSTSPVPLEVGILAHMMFGGLCCQKAPPTFVLTTAFNETQWWALPFDNDGFRQSEQLVVFYPGLGCTGTPYIGAGASSGARPVIEGIVMGSDVLYSTAANSTVGYNSLRVLPSVQCWDNCAPGDPCPFTGIPNVAPLLSRPLADFTTRGEFGTLKPPFKIVRR